MVNSMGHEFSDEGGNTIDLIPGVGDPLIDQEGQVFQGEQLIAKLGVFVFDEPVSQLRKLVVGSSPKKKALSQSQQSPNLLKYSKDF